MKFSSTDKRSETVSLKRNKKIYFIGRNKYIIKKNRVLACFQTRPARPSFVRSCEILPTHKPIASMLVAPMWLSMWGACGWRLPHGRQ